MLQNWNHFKSLSIKQNKVLSFNAWWWCYCLQTGLFYLCHESYSVKAASLALHDLSNFDNYILFLSFERKIE
jgi:hypothetical protein